MEVIMSSKKFVKVFFGVAAVILILLGVVGFIFIVVGATHKTGPTSWKSRRILFGNVEEIHQHQLHHHHHHHVQLINREKQHIKNSDDHLNYGTTKRKVPNGPDPIHNRRAGNSHQPPGQA